MLSKIVDFIVTLYQSQSFCQTGGDCFYDSEVQSLLIPFSKESMKVKKVSKCHEIRNELDTIIIHAHFLRNLKS